MTAASDGRAGLRSLWRRTLQVQFGFRWYLIIFLLFPAVNALALLMAWAAGGSVPDLALARSLAAIPAGIMPTLIIFFITGALAEEYGWRGYALDRVQAKWGAAIGSLLLGILWALWHVPLFFMAGAPQTSSGVSFLLFAAWIVALSPIYTWIYNGTRRSLAAVLLLHWASTIASSILPTNQSETTGLAIISVVILIAMLRRPARELEIPEQPSGYKPAFNQKGKVS